MPPRSLRLLGTGIHLPAQCVGSAALDERLGHPAGWTERKTGVRTRFFVRGETAVTMGAAAGLAALADAGLPLGDIDAIVCASGTAHQPIPCTAALIQEQLGPAAVGLPCFDLNATCVSFIAALDVAASLLLTGRFRRMLIISSEVASLGLNWADPEASLIFGDGAAAAVVGCPGAAETSRVVAARMETHSVGAHLTEIRGGGSALPAACYTVERAGDFLFSMDGKAVFRFASRHLLPFVDRLLAEARLDLRDLGLVVPHQASPAAVRLLVRRLGLRPGQWVDISATHANTIAASVPMALHLALAAGRLRRGEKALLLGTAAGFTMAGLILAY